MRLKIVFLTAVCLLLILYQSKAQNKFGDSKYVIYTDTGYVCFAQPHFLCYFISSNKKTMEETLTQSPYLYYTGVYNNSLKDFYFDNMVNDSTSLLIKTKAGLYGNNGGIIFRDLVFFRAVVNVRATLNEVRFKDKSYSGEVIQYKGRKVKLYRIINPLGIAYDFTYTPLREENR